MQIDSHQHFWRYDAARDAWITDEMRVLRRDFLAEHLAPELGANRACAIDGWEWSLRGLCKLSGLIARLIGMIGTRNFSSRIREYSSMNMVR
jgi:hypothetical protein